MHCAPCHGKKKPIFSTNVDPGGGPLAAVMKALAKLYGCYEHLAGGRVGSAVGSELGAAVGEVGLGLVQALRAGGQLLQPLQGGACQGCVGRGGGGGPPAEPFPGGPGRPSPPGSTPTFSGSSRHRGGP